MSTTNTAKKTSKVEANKRMLDEAIIVGKSLFRRCYGLALSTCMMQVRYQMKSISSLILRLISYQSLTEAACQHLCISIKCSMK